MMLVAVSLLFQGCPYESPVPIEAPSIKINPALLGTWVSAKEGSNETYEVTKKDDYHYSINETDASDHNNYEAYISDVGGAQFLNIRGYEKDSASNYVFYKLNMNSTNEITLSEITENVDEKFSSSADLKKFIKSNMKNSYFFGKEELHLTKK